MKKSFMNNIKHFVDSNVRQRIDRAANNNNDFFGDDLLLVERQFEDIRHLCIEAEKRISALLQSLCSSPLGAYTSNVQASLNNLSNLTNTATTSQSPNPITCPSPTSNQAIVCEQQITTSSNRDKQLPTKESTISNIVQPQVTKTNPILSSNANSNSDDELRADIRRHKKLPIVGFLKFLIKSRHKLKPDSLLATTLTHCSQLQTQLTKLYLTHEQTIELQCLKPIQQMLEIDIPNVIKLRKLFIKSHNDLDSIRTKYNAASQKQQQLQASHFTSTTSYTIAQTTAQQANINKLDQLKKELDDAVGRFEQARDTYATELYAFVCRETELVNLFMKFYQYQAEYQQQACNAIQSSLPSISKTLAITPRKVVFGTPLEEHLRCTGRSVSLVIQLCIHILYTNALNEEGLFRIPGSSVKIKKLKNAINAWFVTLARQDELESSDNHNQQQSLIGGQSSALAIYNLFKDIAGQRPIQTTLVGGDTISSNSNNNTNNQSATNQRDDSALVSLNNSSSPAIHDQHETVFDFHTIAGLLKLYLRELPEPLFTYALYEQWIHATVKTLNNNEQPVALEQVLEQLPKANYDNLHLLIRFLHLLTCHRDSNKMTATNLAITMAPSLIWARPAIQQQLATSEQTLNSDSQIQQQDAMHTLNMQLSSVGMSASLHALVIENLINHAEKLLSGQVQFTLSGLNDITPAVNSEKNQHQEDRCIKSTSPTGLSTASSSSFSSGASTTSSLATSKKQDDRKGGSIEGLLRSSCRNSSKNSKSRPSSVHIGSDNNLQQHQTPPIPPPARSHSRQASDTSYPIRSASSSTHKQPAPPIPPPCTLKRQSYIKSSGSGALNVDEQSTDLKVCKGSQDKLQCAIKTSTASSLRGTGCIVSTTIGNNQNSIRPSVPPPNRPPKHSGDGEDTHHSRTQSVEDDQNPQSDNKSSHSVASSSHLRIDFEEISAVDVEDIDISVPISPVISLDSISGDDSSFDNDCHSLEQSWTECDLVQDKSSKSPTQIDEVVSKVEVAESSIVKPTPRLQRKLNNEEKGTNVGGEKESIAPPIKPPRSISPKVTQSTPL